VIGKFFGVLTGDDGGTSDEKWGNERRSLDTTVWLVTNPNRLGSQVACRPRFEDMLLILAILLLILWGGGFAFHLAGGLIHIILIIAVIMLILHFVRGRGV